MILRSKVVATLLVVIINFAMTLLVLSKLMDMITCFLDGPLVIILILGLFFFVLFKTLWISLTFWTNSFGKFSLILMMSLMFSFYTWAYNYLLSLEVELKVKITLWNLDFSRTLLLSLVEIRERTFEILACLLLSKLDHLLFEDFFITFVLNCKTIHCLKKLLSLLAINLFQLDLQIDKRKSQAANLNCEIWYIYPWLSCSLISVAKSKLLFCKVSRWCSQH